MDTDNRPDPTEKVGTNGEVSPVMSAWNRENWRVLFLLSPAPGTLFRFLERRALTGDAIPFPAFLSDPARPHGYRLLYFPTATREDFPPLAARISSALPHHVILLYRQSGAQPVWGYRAWEGGETVESEESSLGGVSVGLLHLLTSRLSGPASADPPVAFARRRGLPLDRLPLLARAPVSVIEYATVATLDQRNLLVEDERSLYHFDP